MRIQHLAVVLMVAVLAGCSGMKDNPYARNSLGDNPYARQGSSAQGYSAASQGVVSPQQAQADQLEGQSRALFAQGMNAQALVALKQAADLGSGSANYQMARHYIQGIIVARNNALANSYLVRSDAAGYAEGTRVLAWQYLRGSGVQVNIPKGVQLFDKASMSSVRAKREEGLLFLGFLQPALMDKAKGADLLKQAYDAGDAESAYYYSKAMRVVSESEARNALLFAGKAGFPKALMEVSGYALQQGNVEYASATMMKAALAGDADAMYQYANNVLIGRYSVQNRELVAYTWFSLANDYKQPQAYQELRALDGVRRTYDSRVPGYTARVKAETQRMIYQWNPDQA